MDLPQVEWIAVVFVVMTLLAGVLIQIASKDRLMRCPETNGVAFVGVESRKTANGEAIRVGVRQCDLWPKKQGCAQGCVVRYSEMAPGYQVGLEALRPFERP